MAGLCNADPNVGLAKHYGLFPTLASPATVSGRHGSYLVADKAMARLSNRETGHLLGVFGRWWPAPTGA
jgi:hypothetical protein